VLHYTIGMMFALSLVSVVVRQEVFPQEAATKPANLDALVGVDSPLQKNERIAFVGDSITMQGGFAELIANALQEKQAELEVQVTRHGLNGGRVPDMSTGKTPWGEIKPYAEILTDEKPTIVILYLGINDVMHSPGTSPEDFAAGLKDMIQAAQEIGAAVVLATPAVSTENIDSESADQQKLDSYAKICRQVAQNQSASVCDLRQAFLEHLRANNPDKKHHGILTYDGVHMNEAGNRLIAEQMSLAIAAAAQTRHSK
jgi:lysophospholipase L1-like esterase